MSATMATRNLTGQILIALLALLSASHFISYLLLWRDIPLVSLASLLALNDSLTFITCLLYLSINPPPIPLGIYSVVFGGSALSSSVVLYLFIVIDSTISINFLATLLLSILALLSTTNINMTAHLKPFKTTTTAQFN